MLKVIAALLNFAPLVFDWVLAPAAILLLLLALARSTRPFSTLGFSVIAAISGVLLSVVAACVLYLCFGYVRSLLNLLMNFGPSVAGNFLATVARERGGQLIGMVPMIATAAGSGIAAIALRGKSDGRDAH